MSIPLSNLSDVEANALVERLLRERKESQDEGQLPLRGGFHNPLPAADNVALRSSNARLTSPFRARNASGEWAQFDESFGATVVKLGTEQCAQPIITWMPKGVHCIRPEGNPHSNNRPLIVKVKPHMAAIANRHLQAMRAKAAAGDGQKPYFDFNHKTGFAGEPTEFFWDEQKGICASVQWSPEADAAILASRWKSFSPHWINQNGEFLGLFANCGGLLDQYHKPAFTSMPWICPITKRKAMHAVARRFLQSVELRAKEMPGDEFALVKAFNQIQAEQPELHAAYALRKAIEAEHWQDTVLTNA